jgi:excisionase family DNA binding protein
MFQKRLLNAQELAEYLGTSRNSVYQLVCRRIVPFVKIGRSTRFDLQDIDAWIKEHSHECLQER